MLKVSLSGSIDKPVYRKQLFFVRRLDSLIPEQISLKDILPDHHEHELYRYVRFQQDKFMSAWIKCSDRCSGTFYVSKRNFGTTRIISILNLYANLFIEISFSSIDPIL